MMTVAASLPLKADEATCKKVLHDCDDAVTALQKQIAFDQQIISLQTDRYEEQTKELKDESLWKPIAIGSFTVAVSLGVVLFFKH